MVQNRDLWLCSRVVKLISDLSSIFIPLINIMGIDASKPVFVVCKQQGSLILSAFVIRLLESIISKRLLAKFQFSR